MSIYIFLATDVFADVKAPVQRREKGTQIMIVMETKYYFTAVVESSNFAGNTCEL